MRSSYFLHARFLRRWCDRLAWPARGAGLRLLPDGLQGSGWYPVNSTGMAAMLALGFRLGIGCW